jgi:hypothetical protein
MSNKKKKLLLACDSHTHVILNTYKMLSKKFNVTMYCEIRYKKTYPKNFKEKIKFYKVSSFEYLFLVFKSFLFDYIFLKNRMESTIGEELMKVMFNPKNIDKFKDWGFNDI